VSAISRFGALVLAEDLEVMDHPDLEERVGIAIARISPARAWSVCRVPPARWAVC
jgi:hypothetical protein